MTLSFNPYRAPCPLDLQDLREAAGRIVPYVKKTPLLHSRELDELVGCRVFLKDESLQNTGAFKIRGAVNGILTIPEEKRSSGIIAFSSGNHAKAVSLAASLMSLKATVIVPEDMPSAKADNLQGKHVRVIRYHRQRDNRERLALDVCKERGGHLLPPYGNPFVLAGQGTVGLEVWSQCFSSGVIPEAVLAPCGGGGLVAGLARVFSHMPSVNVYAVEPKGFNDLGRSLQSGVHQGHEGGRSLCDGLLTEKTCSESFTINRRLLTGAFSVDDERVMEAMSHLFSLFGRVIEPSGAITLAALMSHRDFFKGKTVVLVLSGGNASRSLVRTALLRFQRGTLDKVA